MGFFKIADMSWIIAILRFWGFIETADKLLVAWEAKRKAKEITNATPLTRQQEMDAIDKLPGD